MCSKMNFVVRAGAVDRCYAVLTVFCCSHSLPMHPCPLASVHTGASDLAAPLIWPPQAQAACAAATAQVLQRRAAAAAHFRVCTGWALLLIPVLFPSPCLASTPATQASERNQSQRTATGTGTGPAWARAAGQQGTQQRAVAHAPRIDSAISVLSMAHGVNPMRGGLRRLEPGAVLQTEAPCCVGTPLDGYL